MQRKIKSKKIKNALKNIASVYSRRCGSYRMYLEGDSPHQVVMIVCKLKWFSHISNRHNMYTLMQSCDVFHTQHTIFFAILDTCADTMWFGHHKIVVERWFWELNMLIGSLVELHVGLHSCLCFSHFEKLVLKAGSTPPRYLLDTLLSVELH